MSRGHIATVIPQVPELSGPALVQLALQTLARFNFKVCRLYFVHSIPLLISLL